MNKNMSKPIVQLPPPPHPSGKTKLAFRFVYVAMAILAIAVAVFLYWALQPRDVLEIKNAPVPVRTIREQPTANGVVILKVDYCKKVKASGRVRTSFISADREIFLPVYEDRQPPQCNGGNPGSDGVEVPVIIPRDLLPGRYHIHYRIAYQVNPLVETVEEFDSLEFDVVDM